MRRSTPSLGDGPLLGKRYADEELGLELLCTRAGDGALDRRRPGAAAQGRQAAAVVRLTGALRGDMNLLLLLDMAAAGRGDEVAVQAGDERLTAAELLAGAWAGAEMAAGAAALAYVGTNGLAFPIGLFAAAAAGVPFVPLNYRLSDDQLHELLAPLGETLVVAEGDAAARRLPARGHRVVDAADVRRDGAGPATAPARCPPTPTGRRCCSTRAAPPSAPKAAVLRHRHLTSYVIGTVEFGGADRTTPRS